MFNILRMEFYILPVSTRARPKIRATCTRAINAAVIWFDDDLGRSGIGDTWHRDPWTNTWMHSPTIEEGRR